MKTARAIIENIAHKVTN